MSAAHVMVILTLLGNGQLSAAFVSTESKDNCEQRAKTVEAILRSGGSDIRLLRCLPSELRFARFTHESSSAAPRYAYLLSVGENSLDVEPVSDLRRCDSLRSDRLAKPGITRYCVSSTQALENAEGLIRMKPGANTWD